MTAKSKASLAGVVAALWQGSTVAPSFPLKVSGDRRYLMDRPGDWVLILETESLGQDR